MNTLQRLPATQRATSASPSTEHTEQAHAATISPFSLIIRGDAPLCGAVCEPLGTDQAKAIAHAVHEHLVQENILTESQTVMVHNGLYQYFSLLEQDFRLLQRIENEIANRMRPRHRFALSTSGIGINGAAFDVVVHTTHRPIPADDPRAPYYVLPIYVVNTTPGDRDPNYVASTPALEARVADLLHAERSELKVVGIFSQHEFDPSGGDAYEAVLADIIRAGIHARQPRMFMAGPVTLFLYNGIVSLPMFTEEEWERCRPRVEYLHTQFVRAQQACATVACRAGARVNFYQGSASWPGQLNPHPLITASPDAQGLQS